MVELRTHLATERAGLETLHLRVRAPVLYPTGVNRITMVLNGHRGVSADTALRLARILRDHAYG